MFSPVQSIPASIAAFSSESYYDEQAAPCLPSSFVPISGIIWGWISQQIRYG